MRHLKGLWHRVTFIWGYDKFAAFRLLVACASVFLFALGLATRNVWAYVLAALASLGAGLGAYKKWRETRAAQLVRIKVFPPQGLAEAAARDGLELVHIGASGNTIALVDAELNQLIRTTPFQFDIATKDYELPLEAQSLIGAVFAARQLPYFTINETKARIASRMDAGVLRERPMVTLQKTDYFSGLVTHELGDRCLVLPRSISTIEPTRYFLEDGKIVPLDVSRASNHLGVTTIALTADRRFVLQREKLGPNGRGKCVASGSGSLDWANVVQASHDNRSFQRLLATGMERELREETNLPDQARCVTVVTGMGRLINRGGKPDFYGASLVDVEFNTLSVSKAEQLYVFELFPVSVPSLAKADIIQTLAEMIVEYRSLNDIAMPLYLALLFARDWYSSLGENEVEDWFASKPGALREAII